MIISRWNLLCFFVLPHRVGGEQKRRRGGEQRRKRAGMSARGGKGEKREGPAEEVKVDEERRRSGKYKIVE